MKQFFEAVAIALQAIWANKLRSILTVIGNVVAVTSIIAVVSLVQGLNATVKDAIQSEFAADSFSVQRRGLTRTEEEPLRAQSNPRITLDDADAIRAFGPNIGLVMAEAAGGAQIDVPRRVARRRSDPRRHARNTTACPRRRSNAAGRSRPASSTPGGRWPSSAGARRTGCSACSIPSTRRHARRRPLPRHRHRAEEGRDLRRVTGRVAVVPLAAFQRLFGLTAIARVDRPAVQSDAGGDRDGRRARGDFACERRLRPKEPDNFGVLSSDTIPQPLQSGHDRHLHDSDRRREPLARRRRHRHHEHHADGGQRADARDRVAKVARRAPSRHPVADPHRVDHACPRSAA